MKQVASPLNRSHFHANLRKKLKYKFSRSKAYQQFQIVGLDFCLVCGTVAVNFTATCAFVYDNVALFCVCYHLDRLHRRATFTGTVAGIYVDVQRPEAKGAVVARGVP